MNKLPLNALVMGLLVSLPTCLPAQGKVTRDPQTTVTPVSATAKEAPDPRLSQEITYDSGYVRLHDVTNYITRVSGVKILCGQNAKDNLVRDTPLVICVKDMPLGKLLQTIANATGTRLTAETVGNDDPEKTYRIYRRSADYQINDAYDKARHEAQIAQAKWVWDAMVAYGKSTEIPGVPSSSWHSARLMATLGPDAWDKLRNGDIICFTPEDSATETIFRDLYQAAWQEEAKASRNAEQTPTDSDIYKATFKIKLVDRPDGWVSLETAFGAIEMGDGSYGYGRTSPGETTRLLREKGMTLPPYPKDPERPSMDLVKIPDMVLLKYRSELWDNPLLRVKIDLEKPADIEHPTFADLIRALASKTGLNIVTEDFISHRYWKDKMDTPIPPDGLFKSGTTIADTLMSINGPGIVNQWFFSEKDKLLVGWDQLRQERHKTLPSEDYIADIHHKYEGSGLELDDVIGMMCLPSLAFDDWIISTKEFRGFERLVIGLNPLWRLYNALEPSDKLLAQSLGGLPFSTSDPAWVAGFLTDQKRQEHLLPENPIAFEMTAQKRDTVKTLRDIDRQFRERVLCDPAVISTLVLRIAKSPATYRTVPDYSDSPPPALGLSSYKLEISYKIDGQQYVRSFAWISGFAFPLRSLEREAEIIQAAKQ